MTIKLSEKLVGKQKVFITEFSNIKEMYEHCNANIINERLFRHRQASIVNKRDFTMTDNYKQAEDLLLNGWSEGAKNLTKQLKIANNKMANKEVKRAVFDVVGFQASVPRYLQGVPQNMINKKNVVQKQKIVTLTKSIAYNASYTPKQILDDSVKFLQLVQEIEKLGIRTNINVVMHSLQDNEEVLFKVKIKSSGERLNISKMSFPLLHPSFLRRMIFRCIEVEQRIKNSWNFGYGRPVPNNKDTQQHLEKNEYFVPVNISEQKMISLVMDVDSTK